MATANTKIVMRKFRGMMAIEPDYSIFERSKHTTSLLTIGGFMLIFKIAFAKRTVWNTLDSEPPA